MDFERLDSFTFGEIKVSPEPAVTKDDQMCIVVTARNEKTGEIISEKLYHNYSEYLAFIRGVAEELGTLDRLPERYLE